MYLNEKENWICIKNFSEYDKEELKDFETAVLQLCQDTNKDVAIDLNGVGFLNSLTIGFLVKVHKQLYAVKRKFAVYNSSDYLQEMADTINLADVIPFYASEKELFI